MTTFATTRTYVIIETLEEAQAISPLPLPCPCGFGNPGDSIWQGAEHDVSCSWYTAGECGPEILVAERA